MGNNNNYNNYYYYYYYPWRRHLANVGDEGGDGLLVLLDFGLAASEKCVEFLDLRCATLLQLLHTTHTHTTQ